MYFLYFIWFLNSLKNQHTGKKRKKTWVWFCSTFPSNQPQEGDIFLIWCVRVCLRFIRVTVVFFLQLRDPPMKHYFTTTRLSVLASGLPLKRPCILKYNMRPYNLYQSLWLHFYHYNRVVIMPSTRALKLKPRPFTSCLLFILLLSLFIYLF